MAEGQTATKNPKQVEEQKHTTEERDMQVHKRTHQVFGNEQNATILRCHAPEDNTIYEMC